MEETQQQTVHPTSYLQTVTEAALGRVCKSCKRPRLGIRLQDRLAMVFASE